MRLSHVIPALLFILLGETLFSQCTRDVTVVFTSITYKAGCDFGDSGGMDPVIEIFRSGQLEFMMYFDDQNQVTGPVQNVPIDLNEDRNWCPPTFGDRYDLGIYSYGIAEVDVQVEIYEKDSRQIINRECDGYDSFWDDDYSTGTHTFNLNDNFGSIDLGGCMVYNYILEKTAESSITVELDFDICLDDTIRINNNPYYFGNSVGTEMVSDPTFGCDTTYIIDLEFHSIPPIQIIEKPDILCPNEIGRIEIRNFFQFELWNWNTGSTEHFTEIMGGGDYSVTIGTNDGCEEIFDFFVDSYDSPTLEIEGNPTLCNGDSTIIDIVTDGDRIVWSSGESSSRLAIYEPGVYEVTVTSSTSSCESIDSIEINEFVRPDFEFVGDSIFCSGGSTMLALDSVFTIQEWNNGEVGSSILVNQNGIYKVTITDENGCTATDEILIEEAAAEVIESDSLSCDETALGILDMMTIDGEGCNIIRRVNILYDSISICNIRYMSATENETCEGSEDGIILIDITEAQIPLLYRLFDQEGNLVRSDEIIDISNTYQINQLTAGNYLIELENIHGITETISEFVVADTLYFELSEDVLIKPGESTILEMNLDTALFEQYFWEQDGQTLCGVECRTTEVTPDTSTIYTAVLFSNDLLCEYRESVIVSVESNRAIYAPNIVSPFIPGNDIFTIEGPDVSEIESFMIYDRWGSQVFNTEELGKGWDGRIDDNFAREGVYFYIAKVKFLDKTSTELTGSITLIH